MAVGDQLGPYRLLAQLGAGGMGEVYRAKDLRLGREVAVKVLPEAFTRDPDRLARFEQEARAVAALSHPSIVVLFDFGTDRGIWYAAMELLEGETLRRCLARSPLPWRRAVELAAAIAEGLTAAHAKGIVHRDLKPENLFLTAGGGAKILDFGLARVEACAQDQAETRPYVPARTDAGTVMGTVGGNADLKAAIWAALNPNSLVPVIGNVGVGYRFIAARFHNLAGQSRLRMPPVHCSTV
jgi:eukaryotic-like serine/threonine-protein kinase